MNRYAAVVVFTLLPGICAADETKDVLKAFSKMAARVETGVNYKDYTSALGDLNFEFKPYAESADADPVVKGHLYVAMMRYSSVAKEWKLKFSRVLTITKGTQWWIATVAAYPDAARDYNDGGAADPSSGDLIIDFLFPFEWRAAAADIQAAKAASRGEIATVPATAAPRSPVNESRAAADQTRKTQDTEPTRPAAGKAASKADLAVCASLSTPDVRQKCVDKVTGR